MLDCAIVSNLREVRVEQPLWPGREPATSEELRIERGLPTAYQSLGPLATTNSPYYGVVTP